MVQEEGKWHQLLQDLRLQLHRGMDGEISSQQRKHGLDYDINFGVNVLRLKAIASDLPANQELADLMWSKGVRELCLLSIYIRPEGTLTLERALGLVHDVGTLEVAEQLCFSLLRKLPYAITLMKKLFLDPIESCSPSATVPYLLLNHLASAKELTPSLFNELSPRIVQDFTCPHFYSISTIYNALQRVALDRPDLPLEHICHKVIGKGNSQAKALAEQLLSIIEESHDESKD